MAIKHSAWKAGGERGFDYEWNEDHIIDSDIDFLGFSGINLGEPINPSDIATKNYVDATAGIATYETTFEYDFPDGWWHTLASITINVPENAKVLLMAKCSGYIYTKRGDINIMFRKDATNLSETEISASTTQRVLDGELTIVALSTHKIDAPEPGTHTYYVRGAQQRGDIAGTTRCFYGLFTIIVFR